jgi:hypothetical protein
MSDFAQNHHHVRASQQFEAGRARGVNGRSEISFRIYSLTTDGPNGSFETTPVY